MLNLLQEQIETTKIILPLFLLAFAVIFVIFIAFMIFLISRVVKRRSYDPARGAKVKALANELKWSFFQKAEPSLLPNFKLLENREGLNPVALENFISANIEGNSLAVFDHVYRRQSGGGRGGTITHRETVCYLESGRLNLPFFRVSPEGTLEKFAGLVETDIDFPNRPLFSDKFFLRSENETAIRQKFNDGVLNFFEQRQGISTAGRANSIYLYYENRLLEPEHIGFLIDSAIQLQRAL